ncbi:mCG145437, partial [Mus musculus]
FWRGTETEGGGTEQDSLKLSSRHYRLITMCQETRPSTSRTLDPQGRTWQSCLLEQNMKCSRYSNNTQISQRKTHQFIRFCTVHETLTIHSFGTLGQKSGGHSKQITVLLPPPLPHCSSW